MLRGLEQQVDLTQQPLPIWLYQCQASKLSSGPCSVTVSSKLRCETVRMLPCAFQLLHAQNLAAKETGHSNPILCNLSTVLRATVVPIEANLGLRKQRCII